MSLQSGSRIGAYEVTGQLGAGGMGEVYRARDTKLDRDVALKILPPEFAKDAERVGRFRREAKTLASINHPHIAQIHGLEETPDGTLALVMELVEGEDLAQRLKRGPIPIDEALPIARQIAEALEAAHEQGIVHRDLKPANIKVRNDGTVKVLDFGLAKAIEPGAGSREPGADQANSPTITSPAMTMHGVILGTAAYMAPEQAKGKPVDRRADIWAFGCVLYEMLTGSRAFDGEDTTEILGGIVKTDPDWSRLTGRADAVTIALVRRCLQKDLRKRQQHIGDARLALDEAVTAPAASPAVARRPSWLPWSVAAVAIAVAIVATVMLLRPVPGTVAPQIRFEISSSRPFMVNGPPQALSPDGSRLAFTAPPVPSTRPKVWIRALNAVETVELAGTEGATDPFWSPDGHHIGFFADRKLKRVAATGGPVMVLCDANVSGGGSWSADNVIVFSGPSGLLRVSAAGGEPASLTTVDTNTGEISHRWPAFLPDGRTLVFLRIGATEKAIHAAKLDGTVDKRILVSDSKAEYSAGHLIYVRSNVLTAVPFDVAQLTTTSDGVPLAVDVESNLSSGFAAFAASASGVLSYRSSTVIDSQLTWFDRGGRPLRTVGEPAPIVQLSLSHDERRIAVQKSQGQRSRGEVQLYDERGAVTQFATEVAGPVWSPDGRELVYFSAVGGVNAVFRRAVGQAEGRRILAGIGSPIPEDWSRDGRHLVYLELAAGQPGLFVVPADGGQPQRIHGNDEAQFSPDSRWLLYQSNDSGPSQIHVQPWPGTGEHTPLTLGGGRQPKWRADGKEFYYLRPDGMLMAQAIRLGARVETDEPRTLFQTRVLPSIAYDQYAVSADGQRFLVATPVDQAQAPLTVVVNWPASDAELRPR